MWKKLALLTAASLTAGVCRQWWAQARDRRLHEEQRAALQRWEDEGGLGPAAPGAARPAGS